MKLASLTLALALCTPILFAKVGPASAAQPTWWNLTRANPDDAEPTKCELSTTSPAQTYEDYTQARFPQQVRIDDDGADTVTVVVLGDTPEAAQYRDASVGHHVQPILPFQFQYFRTEAACRAAEQAIRDKTEADQHTLDKYRGSTENEAAARKAAKAAEARAAAEKAAAEAERAAEQTHEAARKANPVTTADWLERI